MPPNGLDKNRGVWTGSGRGLDSGLDGSGRVLALAWARDSEGGSDNRNSKAMAGGIRNIPCQHVGTVVLNHNALVGFAPVCPFLIKRPGRFRSCLSQTGAKPTGTFDEIYPANTLELLF